MKFEYKLIQIHPSIFVLKVDNAYDLGMIFLRSEEFYESANENFCGKDFTLLAYMAWYSKVYAKDNTFSYGIDFRGFNVPSAMIEKCYAVNKERTPYDNFMLDLHQAIVDTGVSEYYLLGVLLDDKEGVLEHELAHAFFALDANYRRAMTQLVSLLPFQQEMFAFLERTFEYSKHVHIDETQAYMATGLVDELGDKRQEYEQFTEPFKQVFSEWRSEITQNVTLIHKTVDLFGTNHI